MTQAEFSQHVGSSFRVKRLPKEIDLDLVEVQGYVSQPHEQKGLERFSVFFQGSLDLFLPQGTYLLKHGRMGEFEIFMVPIGREENGYRYEAVFNYSIK